ncbi:hypothetical protein [Janibacter terrae]|uniref:hypothetical protein n=1 Tax=Janibacter terrae TaxID=103817 RepID=UPI000A624A32|nr:hypothetical protein [Janibacter terrae]
MWWLLGGIAAAIAGLGAVIARRGGSMSSRRVATRRTAAEGHVMHENHRLRA